MTTTRLRAPRRIRAGARRAGEAGANLVCAVLAASELEWVGADLRTGALVRSPLEQAAAFLPDAATEQTEPARRRRRLRRDPRLEVVSFPLAVEEEPFDPARPEAAHPAERPRSLGRLPARHGRRLLDALATPDRHGGPLLGTWGPSVAFVDLDGSVPSLALIALKSTRFALGRGADGAAEASFSWAGRGLRLPVADPLLARVAEAATAPLDGSALGALVGFRPGYALVALGAPAGGHLRKVVLSLLAG